MAIRSLDNRRWAGGRATLLPCERHQRRANVLVFVVAMLGLLFMAGAAFLRTVTAESQSIVIETEQVAVDSLIDTLEAEVFAALDRGWLGPEGPYTIQDSNKLLDTSTIFVYMAGPTYGDLSGVSGLLSPIEPFQNSGGELEFDSTTQFDMMTTSQAAALLAPLVPAQAVPFFDVDADGNGIADSRAVPLSSVSPLLVGEAFIPSHILDPVVEQLNAGGSTAQLILAMRILSNSGMVNLNYSHPFLINNVLVDDPLDLDGDVNLDNAPYEPRMEENTLRNGMLLPPQALPATVLHGQPGDPENPGDLADILFPPDETNESYRWWPFETADAEQGGGVWFRRMESEAMNQGEFDRRHLVTTISSDDLFIRSDLITSTNDPLGDGSAIGLDWMGVILDEYDNSDAAWGSPGIQNQYDLDVLYNMQPGTSVGPYGTDYAYDAYPAGLAIDDPRKGRVQLSLSWIENQLLTYDSDGNPLQGLLGIDHIAASPGSAESIAAVRLIQDAFTLMLRNHLGGGSVVTVDIPLTAASLTANLIDYADSDGIPTEVFVRGSTGPPYILDGLADPTRPVYGLERQPYISELFTMVVSDPISGLPDAVDPTQSVSAIELFNPYATTITGAEVAGYDLVIGGAAFPLPAIPMLPNSFLVLWNGVDDTSAPSSAIPLGSLGEWVLIATTEVDLVRRDDGILPAIVVDRFDPAVNGFAFAQIPYPETPDDGDSLQRDTTVTFCPNPALGCGGSTNPVVLAALGRWKVVVPVAKETVGHSMNGPNANRFNTESTAATRPVQADFANTGFLAGVLEPGLTPAFPTTGSMLLLMRHANRGTADPVNDVPFTAWLAGGPNPAGDESGEIDNGRMPVFDVAMSYHSSAASPGAGIPLGQLVDGLNALPWGQYLFDYFTVLPLDDPGGELPLSSPKVEEVGARVHGRININAAPWKVLEGLPLIEFNALPGPYSGQLADHIDPVNGHPSGTGELSIGPELAKAIVAYRELRSIPAAPAAGAAQTGNYGSDGLVVYRDVNDPMATLRRGRGFLTVGELLEVRHPYWDTNYIQRGVRYLGNPAASGDLITTWRMDSGVVGRLDSAMPAEQAEDFVSAVAVMVALEDWVTTRSHVFTVYGTVSGNAATGNKIRFQETVDRLPSLLEGTGPERIGERIVEE